ncbi:MAG: hypothetical protein ABJN36_05195 [Cyclobacteriaceae bacterium]
MLKDYVVKKPYKKISFHGEFQQELLHALPFAYWHFKNGTLKSTQSTGLTRELYFFSADHHESDESRDYQDNFNLEIPNSSHDLKLDMAKWLPVPLKQQYQNGIYLFNKPILIIANRFNTEWSQEPISYFDLEVLDTMMGLLKPQYQILYNRPPASEIVEDNSEVKELGDYLWIKENHPEVVQLTDLYRDKESMAKNYNHLQLLVYANCERFISIHGGTATLASNFGGQNIIYSRKGHEHYLKEFESVFPKLSGAQIYHVKDYQALLETIRKEYVNG